MENISSSPASHFRPHHSSWLHNTLSEVDAKFKTILNLVEDDDGETFAKRAEMYYQNKPQLLQLVQDLHKSYRVLAENHDQLKSDSYRLCNSNSFQGDLPTPVVVVETAENESYDNLVRIADDEEDSSIKVECGTASTDDDDDEVAAEVNGLEDGGDGGQCGGAEAFWDGMKSSVALLRDNESVLVSFLRKYEEQRAEIRTLKSEVRFVRCLLDVERLERQEKRRSSGGISKFKKAFGGLISGRKN